MHFASRHGYVQHLSYWKDSTPMSVRRASQNSAATRRLMTAIDASNPQRKQADKPKASTNDSSKPRRVSQSDAASSTRELGSTTRTKKMQGASAAPDANRGAGAVMGSGQPGSTRPATFEAPATVASTEANSGSASAWNAEWQQVFEDLQLAPADIAYLSQAGYSNADLERIASDLAGVDPLQSNTPAEGIDAGSAQSADFQGIDSPSSTSAWSPEWANRFSSVMKQMGMTDAQISEQIASVEGQSVTEEQLQSTYEQMKQSVGAFNEQWRDKFTKILTELKTPEADQQQVLQQLAGSGLSESQLTEAYTRMQNSKPAWNEEWENKFQALKVPDELLKQLEESGASEDALSKQYDQMLDTKIEFKRDGRLKQLEKAGANNEELWSIMLSGKDGKEFDKMVSQVKSAHVPAWKRIGSFALNLVPGVYALQFVTGKDWVTGEKIDRSNPLNIVGAVASGFAGFTAVRSAVAGVQGLSAANAAAQATKAAAGGAALSDAVSATSSLSQGSFKAMQAAGLVSKFDKGLKFGDYVKAATPILNRFGEAGRLSAFGRGYYQSMQLTAGMAAMKSVGEGKHVVDAKTQQAVLGELKKGSSIDDALAQAGRSGGKSGGFSFTTENVIRDGRRYGFLQGAVGKAGEGNRIVRGNGNFNFNPFKNNATISTTATDDVFSLGRGVNFGSRAGLAQGLGVVKGANWASRNSTASARAMALAQDNPLMLDAAQAQKLTGLNMVDDVQRIETLAKTQEWATKLGVTDGSKFRSLLQLNNSARSVRSITGVVERGGDTGYRVARQGAALAQKYTSYMATPLIGGAAVGMTGRQMQPAWEYWQNRDEIRAQEAEANAQAAQESAELEQLYAEQQAAQSSQETPASDNAASGEAPVYVDESTGYYVDPQTGYMADPSTGMVYDQSGNVVGNLSQEDAA